MVLGKRMLTLGILGLLIISAFGMTPGFGTASTTRAAPSITSEYPPGGSNILKEGSTYNAKFSVNVTDTDSSSLTFTWYVDDAQKKTEDLGPTSGTDFEASFVWVPPRGSAGNHTVKVEVSDGTDTVNYVWNDVKVFARSGAVEMNANTSSYVKPLSIKISYLYNNAPNVDVRSGLTVSDNTGNKSFGTPVFGFFYDVLYNITVYPPSIEHPFPTVEFINMSINFSTSSIRDEFKPDSVRIVAWDFTKGIWNDIENIGEYQDLNIRKGIITGKYIAWLNLTIGGSRRATRDDVTYVEYLFHLGLFGERPLRVKDTEPRYNATEVSQTGNITASFNMPIFTTEDLKNIIASMYPDYTDEEINQTLYNLTILNESMLSGTTLENAIALYKGETSVNGTIAYDRSYNKIIFIPDHALEANTVYKATVKKTVTDIFGHTLDGNENFVEGENDDDYVWTFTTVKISQIIPGPQVVSTNPANGQKNVPLNTTITVVFDSSMDPTSFNNGVSLINSKGSSVAVTTSYDDASHTLTITPGTELLPNEEYQVTLKYTIKDAQGHFLDGNGDGVQGENNNDDYVFVFYTVEVQYGNITGTVVDKETGEPIKDLSVKVVEINKVLYTDENGTFTVTMVPVGNYTVVVEDNRPVIDRYFSAQKTVTVEADKDNEVSFSLELNKSASNSEPVIQGAIQITPSDEYNEYFVGTTLNFTANITDPDGDPLNITWYVGTNRSNLTEVIGHGSKVTYKFDQEGTYFIRVVVRDDHDNEADRDIKVSILKRPSGKITTVDDETEKIMGLSKPVFYGVVVALILLIAVIIAVIRLVTLGEEDEDEDEEDEDETYECPNCGKEIPMSAEKCPYCGEDLSME